ncbi:MAG: UDP-3-O-(3-hydroxymyristoyl)glucosamine N-acyltransferase [Deltaproteobacteria bacterium]|jgi:UDP-3-O-[3-hydroxymyristoyl] glucosamine N-acyltransferase|nr:UDP-3-O-(3-hydroxymyristoyl)glucosamine N-acyltransferase [Deltaproteobacteria bacterium]
MIPFPQPQPLGRLVEQASRRLAEQLALLGGPDQPPSFPVEGDDGVLVAGLASAAEAGPGLLTFAQNAEFLRQAAGAAAVICPPGLVWSASAATTAPGPRRGQAPSQAAGQAPGQTPGQASGQVSDLASGQAAAPVPALVRAPDPKLLFTIILGLAEPDGGRGAAWATARPFFKDEASTTLGPGCVFGPYVHVGARVRLGRGVQVGPGCFIDDDVTVGDDTILHPRVTLRWGVKVGARCQIRSGAVIGEDGFGYSQIPAPGGRLIHFKNPHAGGVTIEDDVEIGALAAIDRGLLADTFVGRGAKIDNLVQIGHNCRLGRDCLLAGQAGLAGHVEVGDRAFLLGQVGLSHGVTIGADAVVAGQAGVLGVIPPGRRVWTGTPAQPQADEYRSQVMTRKDLPKWRRFLKLFRKSRTFEELKAAEAQAEAREPASQDQGDRL